MQVSRLLGMNLHFVIAHSSMPNRSGVVNDSDDMPFELDRPENEEVQVVCTRCQRPSITDLAGLEGQVRNGWVASRRISAKVWLTSVSCTPRRVTNSIFVLRR